MPTSPRCNEKNHIPLSAFALAAKFPEILHLRDYGIPLTGAPEFGTWSGHYGLGSQQEALFMSFAEATATNHHHFHLQASCPVGNLSGLHKGKSHTAESVAETGFLHIGRAQKDFAREIRVMLLARMASELSRSAYSKAEKLTLKDLMSAHPRTAVWVLEAYPAVLLLVHPMPRSFVAGHTMADGWIGTVRQELAKQMKAEVKYHEEQILACY